MATSPRKMSEILKELSDRLLRNPDRARTQEAAELSLMFANIAWNETVGLVHPREQYRSTWEIIEADNPEVWSEFNSNDPDAMIDELVQFKMQRYPGDQRRILACGVPDGRIRVDWLPPAAPGVDSKWEMRLYGLVRTGACEEAIQFLRESRGMSLNQAMRRVAEIAAELGMA